MPSPIDASWLAAATRWELDVIGAEPIGAGIGLLGAVWRVRLAGAPVASVIVKLPSTDPATAAIVEQFGYGRREAGTYRELLAGHDDLPAPRCHAVVDTAAGPAFVLEDLGDHRAGDQLAGATREELLEVARLAAQVHAAFWEMDRLTMLPWLPGPADDVIAGYGRLFTWTWPGATAALAASAPEVPASHLVAAERAMARFDEVIAAFAQAPHTLVHGDLRLDNILFAPDARGRTVAVDWQLAARGRGPYDLAFLLAGSAEPEVRRAAEADVLQTYADELARRGVAGYGLDEVRLDYRRGLVMNLPNPVTALVAVPPGNERGRRLLTRNLVRALAAVADHEPFLSLP